MNKKKLYYMKHLKHIKIFETYCNEYKSSIKEFMKMYPVGTIFTFDNGHVFEIEDFNPTSENNVIGALYSPDGELLDENNSKSHDTILALLERNWRVIEKTNEKKEEDDGPYFKLIKDVGKFKKGKIWACFGGLVRGVNIEIDGKKLTLNFDDREYFKMLPDKKTNEKKEEEDDGPYFKLIKDVGKFKKGKIWACFGGLVRGVNIEIDGKKLTLNFDDREYFKMLPDKKTNENLLPRPYKKIKCLECGEEVCDNINYKIGHLYNKHNCKPSVGDYKAKKMMKEYFPRTS